jgi:hypothetical protein
VPDIEIIVLRSGLSPAGTARRLAAALGAEIISTGPAVVSLRRPGTVPGQWLVAEVLANDYGGDDPRHHGETVYDHYDTAVELWLEGAAGAVGAETLHAEVRHVFDAITTAVPWPALHGDIGGTLYAAAAPNRGRTTFPPGTTYDESNRPRWEPWTHSAEPLEQP